MDCDDRPAASRPRSPWAVMDGTRREGLALLYSLAATGRCASAAAIAGRGHGRGRRGALDQSRPAAEVAQRRAPQREETGRHLAGAAAWFVGDTRRRPERQPVRA